MNSNFGCNAKAPLWLGPVVSSLLVGPGSLNEEVLLQKPEPGVVGMSPVDQEITRKALKTSLDLKNKQKKSGRVATLLLLMNVHIVTMYVS